MGNNEKKYKDAAAFVKNTRKRKKSISFSRASWNEAALTLTLAGKRQLRRTEWKGNWERSSLMSFGSMSRIWKCS